MLILIAPNLSERPLNQTLNALIEGAEPPSVNYRQYLGASTIGAECLRQNTVSTGFAIRNSRHGSKIFLRAGIFLKSYRASI